MYKQCIYKSCESYKAAALMLFIAPMKFGPAPVLFWSGTHVRRPSVRRPRV